MQEISSESADVEKATVIPYFSLKLLPVICGTFET
jgi:hypothetical protein